MQELDIVFFIYHYTVQVVFKHDTVRVIQICIKYGSAEQRAKLFDQFKGICIYCFFGSFSDTVNLGKICVGL